MKFYVQNIEYTNPIFSLLHAKIHHQSVCCCHNLITSLQQQFRQATAFQVMFPRLDGYLELPLITWYAEENYMTWFSNESVSS